MGRRAPDTITAASIHVQTMADFDAASAEEPPAPSDIFARLGVLVAVAACFGLAAQFLVGIPH
jgi:hypothetical protein